MLPASETIYIRRGTFGTQLEFSLFDGDTMKDQAASAYTKIVLRATSLATNKEQFSGEVTETLSAVTTNVINYVLKETDTLKVGTFALTLDLLTMNTEETVVLSKEALYVGKLRIE